MIAVLHSQTFNLRADATYTISVGDTVQEIARRPMNMDIPEEAFRSRRPDMSILPELLDGWRRGWTQPPLPAPTPPPLEGEERSFWVSGDNRQVQIDTEAVYVSGTLAIFLDRSTRPLATIDDADLQEIAEGYEQVVLPREHQFFGHESDINEDGTVFVVMSRVVNENDGPVAYFSPCDLMEEGAVPGCLHTNLAEILYLTPPDALNDRMGSPTAILETLAHETNHMIFMNTRYLQHGEASNVENMYLLER